MIEQNYLLFAFIAVYVLQSLFALWLEWLNTRHMKVSSRRVPEAFEGFVDAARLEKITTYTLAKSRTGAIHHIVSDIVFLTIILSGLLVALQRMFVSGGIHPMLSGLLFFMIPALIMYAVEMPFDYYRTFTLEERFGFNRSTLRLWLIDQLKSGLLSLVFFCLLFFPVLWLISAFPRTWWLWGFGIVSAVQILLAAVYPVLIAPIFNKFEPIRDEVLAERIMKLMADNGIQVKRILQMNAGIRSRHSNAYFTGFGKTKQIVLYDTLLEAHPHDEILSILGHEAGHFKERHILKQILLFEVLMLAGFYLTYRLLDWTPLYEAFGFDAPVPYVGLFLISILWQKAGFFLQPVSMAVSRHFERQADVFGARLLCTPRPLMTALKRMASENLSNLTPHPLYVRFHYSHPPLLERLERLDRTDKTMCDHSRGASMGLRESHPC